MTWLTQYLTWIKIGFFALLGAAALFFRGQAANAKAKLAETGKQVAERRAEQVARANQRATAARVEEQQEVERAIDHAGDPGARRDHFE